MFPSLSAGFINKHSFDQNNSNRKVVIGKYTNDPITTIDIPQIILPTIQNIALNGYSSVVEEKTINKDTRSNSVSSSSSNIVKNAEVAWPELHQMLSPIIRQLLDISYEHRSIGTVPNGRLISGEGERASVTSAAVNAALMSFYPNNNKRPRSDNDKDSDEIDKDKRNNKNIDNKEMTNKDSVLISSSVSPPSSNSTTPFSGVLPIVLEGDDFLKENELIIDQWDFYLSSSPPFTIQRLCEIILDHRRNHCFEGIPVHNNNNKHKNQLSIPESMMILMREDEEEKEEKMLDKNEENKNTDEALYSSSIPLPISQPFDEASSSKLTNTDCQKETLLNSNAAQENNRVVITKGKLRGEKLQTAIRKCIFVSSSEEV